MSARTRPADEGGWALITALLLMLVMMTLGLAVLSMVDTGQQHARAERVRESSFNLADAVLSAQAFAISRSWPGGVNAGGSAVPCAGSISTGTGTADARCPDPARLAGAFDSVDYATGATFSTLVRDNEPDRTFYDDAVAAPPHDANGDKRLWVRSQATVGGKTRTIVALVRVDEQPLGFPNRVLIAGKLATTNSGDKAIIVTRDNATGDYAPVSVRCDPAAAGCLDFDQSKAQIVPYTVEDEPFPMQQALSDEAVRQLREAARANGTLFTGCPPSLQGDVVFIDGPANCEYRANGVANSRERPGMVIIENGTLLVNGDFTFYGLLYARNAQRSTDHVITLTGTTQVFGAVMVDYAGGLLAGSSKINLVYDPKVFRNARVIGEGTIVRNTWRELPMTRP